MSNRLINAIPIRTLAEVAEMMGLSEETVRLAEKSAFEKLKARLGVKLYWYFDLEENHED